MNSRTEDFLDVSLGGEYRGLDAAIEQYQAGETQKASVTLHDTIYNGIFGEGKKRITDKDKFDKTIGSFFGNEELREILTSPFGEEFQTTATELFNLYNAAHDHAEKRDAAKEASPESKNKAVQIFEKFWNKMKSLFHAAAAAYIQEKRAQGKMNHLADLADKVKHIADLADGKEWGQRSAKMWEAAKAIVNKFKESVHSSAVAAGKQMSAAGASLKERVKKHIPKTKSATGKGTAV